MSGVPYSLSFHFMMDKVKGFKECVESNDKKKFEEYLYALGMDVKQGYDVVSIEHRPYRDKPFSWVGPRVEGYERIDAEYIKSGVASIDALVASCPDPTKRAFLNTLRREGSSDGSWYEEQ